MRALPAANGRKEGMDVNLKGKRLLLLGGSRITCEIVRHARAMGITTGEIGRAHV